MFLCKLITNLLRLDIDFCKLIFIKYGLLFFSFPDTVELKLKMLSVNNIMLMALKENLINFSVQNLIDINTIIDKYQLNLYKSGRMVSERRLMLFVKHIFKNAI